MTLAKYTAISAADQQLKTCIDKNEARPIIAGKYGEEKNEPPPANAAPNEQAATSTDNTTSTNLFRVDIFATIGNCGSSKFATTMKKERGAQVTNCSNQGATYLSISGFIDWNPSTSCMKVGRFAGFSTQQHCTIRKSSAEQFLGRGCGVARSNKNDHGQAFGHVSIPT